MKGKTCSVQSAGHQKLSNAPPGGRWRGRATGSCYLPRQTDESEITVCVCCNLAAGENPDACRYTVRGIYAREKYCDKTVCSSCYALLRWTDHTEITRHQILFNRAHMYLLKAEILEFSVTPLERLVELENARLYGNTPPDCTRKQAMTMRRLAHALIASIPPEFKHQKLNIQMLSE